MAANSRLVGDVGRHSGARWLRSPVGHLVRGWGIGSLALLGSLGLLLVQVLLAGESGLPEAPERGSHRLFSIAEYDLYPESIAHDSVSGDFFLSSMSSSRILRVHPDGAYEDFIDPAAGHLRGSGSIGMKVDAKRRLLWVCTGRYFLFAGEDKVPAKTGVVLFDLHDGSVRQSWLMDQPSPAHIFNDLALTSDGTAYVTTTMFGKIYRLSPDSEAMELVLETPGSHNNGITLGPNERYLFFTLDRLLRRLDLKTGAVIPVEVSESAEVGTDGLYFVDGSLVVVKPRSRQIARLFLNDALDAVETVEVLAEGHPDFVYPTTGVVVKDSLVFVATSFADVARNPASVRQHPAVLVHRVGLGGAP